MRTRYAKWTVVGSGSPSKDGSLRMLCRCVCGNTSHIRLVTLRTGASRSCRSCAAKGTKNALKIGPHTRRKIRELYLKGASQVGLATRFRCSKGTVWSIVRDLLVQRRLNSHARTIEKYKRLTAAQRGWIAGIIDGEGWVGFSKLNNGAYIQPRIDVGSTTRRMQATLKKLLGGHIHRQSRAEKNQKDMYRWSVWSYERVQAVLEIVAPYLIVKRKQAQVVLSYCRRRLSARYSAIGFRDQQAYKRVRLLNKRGRNG